MECPVCHKDEMTFSGECKECGVFLCCNGYPGNDRDRFHWPNAGPQKQKFRTIGGVTSVDSAASGSEGWKYSAGAD